MHIRFDNADLRFGDRVALQPLTLSLVEPRIGVIGLNGSGKTSFARLIAGLAKPTFGTVTLDGLDTVTDEKDHIAGTILQWGGDAVAKRGLGGPAQFGRA